MLPQKALVAPKHPLQTRMILVTIPILIIFDYTNDEPHHPFNIHPTPPPSRGCVKRVAYDKTYLYSSMKRALLADKKLG